MGGEGRICLHNVQHKIAGEHHFLEIDGGVLYLQLGCVEKADATQIKTALYAAFTMMLQHDGSMMTLCQCVSGRVT